MTTTTLTLAPTYGNRYEPFTITVESTDADRVKRLLESALRSFESDQAQRDIRNSARVRSEALRARNAERTRIKGALKRLGIEVRAMDGYSRYGADLASVDHYSEKTTAGWLSLGGGKSYQILDMVAKLSVQSALLWKLEERTVYGTSKETVLYVSLPAQPVSE